MAHFLALCLPRPHVPLPGHGLPSRWGPTQYHGEERRKYARRSSKVYISHPPCVGGWYLFSTQPDFDAYQNVIIMCNGYWEVITV